MDSFAAREQRRCELVLTLATDQDHCGQMLHDDFLSALAIEGHSFRWQSS